MFSGVHFLKYIFSVFNHSVAMKPAKSGMLHKLLMVDGGLL